MKCRVCDLTTWSFPSDKPFCFLHRDREKPRVSFGGSYPTDRNGHEMLPICEWPKQ